eukprot:m.43734 g.43734  ORF g.43734 m.43734 type:complete len:515 (-) comp15062_c0_seq5:3054-4598(-)
MEALWPRSRSDVAVASVRETLYELHKLAGTEPVAKEAVRAVPTPQFSEEAYRVADIPSSSDPQESQASGPIDVFISHADGDIKFAKRVAASLTSLGHHICLSSQYPAAEISVSGSLNPNRIESTTGNIPRRRSSWRKGISPRSHTSSSKNATGSQASTTILDRANTIPGAALARSTVVVAILSQCYLSSRQQSDEMALAYVLNKPLFPICKQRSDKLGHISFRVRLLLTLVGIIFFDEYNESAMHTLLCRIQGAPIKIERARADGDEDTYGGDYQGTHDPRKRTTMYGSVTIPMDDFDDFWQPRFGADVEVVPWDAFASAVLALPQLHLMPCPNDVIDVLYHELRRHMRAKPTVVSFTALLQVLECTTKCTFSVSDLCEFAMNRLLLTFNVEVAMGAQSTVADGGILAVAVEPDNRVRAMMVAAIVDAITFEGFNGGAKTSSNIDVAVRLARLGSESRSQCHQTERVLVDEFWTLVAAELQDAGTYSKGSALDAVLSALETAGLCSENALKLAP